MFNNLNYFNNYCWSLSWTHTLKILIIFIDLVVRTIVSLFL